MERETISTHAKYMGKISSSKNMCSPPTQSFIEDTKEIIQDKDTKRMDGWLAGWMDEQLLDNHSSDTLHLFLFSSETHSWQVINCCLARW